MQQKRPPASPAASPLCPQLLAVVSSAKGALVAFAVSLGVMLAVLMLIAECAVVAVVGIVKAAAGVRVEGLASQHVPTRDLGAVAEAECAGRVYASPEIVIATIVAVVVTVLVSIIVTVGVAIVVAIVVAIILGGCISDRARHHC